MSVARVFIENHVNPDLDTPPDVAARNVAAEAERDASEYVVLAKALPVSSQEDYEAAGEELKAIKTKIKDLESKRLAITNPFMEKKRQVDALFRAPLALLAQAESSLKEKMSAYFSEVEKKRKAEEAERRAEAARLAREAAKAEANGQEGKATRKLAEAVAVVNSLLPSTAPSASGVSHSSIWDFEVVDFLALVKAVAAGKAPICLLQPNDTEIRKKVRALGEEHSMPGVVAFKKSVVRASSR